MLRGLEDEHQRPVLLYCVIAVLLNAVLALAWVLWREIEYSQADQIIELRSRLKGLADIALLIRFTWSFWRQERSEGTAQ